MEQLDARPTALVSRAGSRFLVWNVDEIVWLRSKCRLATTPIGSCAMKVSTRGKAAAVPVLLSDEELYTAISNEWVRVEEHSGEPLDAAVALQLSLGHDDDGRQALRRLVHRDLTSRGYALTNGIKFGVDFLAYRGDPTAVHAAFMVMVTRSGHGISTLDLVARSRVATTALKIAVIAWADVAAPPTEAVRYAAFKRMGPGTAIFADTSAQAAGMQAAEAAGPGALFVQMEGGLDEAAAEGGM
jgi:tRNA splicing endonuclease